MSGEAEDEIRSRARKLAERLDRPVVLVGLMGAGKSAVGRRLATTMGLPFVDADREIEQAAGCPITEIFARYGQDAFRDAERRVIARLLEGGVRVLATGGGAFMNPETRRRIAGSAISLWLRAELDILVERTARRSTRPLLKEGNPRDVLSRLMAERYPVYAEADLVVESRDAPLGDTVAAVIAALENHLDGAAPAGGVGARGVLPADSLPQPRRRP